VSLCLYGRLQSCPSPPVFTSLSVSRRTRAPTVAATFHEAALQTVVNELSLPLALRETLYAQQARVPEEDLETGAFDDADRLLYQVRRVLTRDWICAQHGFLDVAWQWSSGTGS
jgi:hypothetical protein